MRSLTMVGLLLELLGIAGLLIENVQITETKKVVDIGPLQVKTEEQHNIPIPTIAGIVAVIAGLGMIVASKRTA